MFRILDCDDDGYNDDYDNSSSNSRNDYEDDVGSINQLGILLHFPLLNSIVYSNCSKKDNSNGVIFSSRPLRNGETFEVQLDRESEHVLRSGLEIGITDLDPVTLRSSLPRTATDLHTGLTVMVSGQKIVANGRQVDTIKRNVYDLQVITDIRILSCEDKMQF